MDLKSRVLWNVLKCKKPFRAALQYYHQVKHFHPPLLTVTLDLTNPVLFLKETVIQRVK